MTPQMVSTHAGALEIYTTNTGFRASRYASGSVQSWEKACLQGGIVDVSFSLPGEPGAPGVWRAPLRRPPPPGTLLLPPAHRRRCHATHRHLDAHSLCFCLRHARPAISSQARHLDARQPRASNLPALERWPLALLLRRVRPVSRRAGGTLGLGAIASAPSWNLPGTFPSARHPPPQQTHEPTRHSTHRYPVPATARHCSPLPPRGTLLPRGTVLSACSDRDTGAF